MKEPWEWTEDDISLLIEQEVKESIELDYKECASLEKTDKRKNEISKDISAFANSAGGTIVYGAKEDGHIPTNIDCGYDPNDITKEWLEQVINTRIHRRIDGIRINQIELKKTSPGKVIYVVYIPQSKRAPHMASDNKFYKRYNFESIPMEEYEVRDVAHREDGPDVSLGFVTEDELNFSGDNLMSDPIPFRIIIGNNSPVPAKNIVISLSLDKRIGIDSYGALNANGDKTVKINGCEYNVHCMYLNWSPISHMPFFSGANFDVSKMLIRFPKDKSKFILGWQLQAPYMESRHQVLLINYDGKKLVFTEIE